MKFFRAELSSKVRSWRGLLLLSALIFTGGWAQSATLKDLIGHTRRILGDTPYYSSVPKLTDQKIISYLNEGQHFAAAYSWAFMQRTEFQLTAGTTEYALPLDYQAVRRVTLDNAIIAERTLDALDDTGAKWIEASGRPRYYYTRTTTYTVMGFNPSPSANGLGTIQVDYIAQVRDMRNLMDVPFNGVPDLYPLHESLAKFAAYRFYLLTGNLPAADVYAKEVASDFKRLDEIVKTKPNYRPGFEPQRQ